jgi:malate dehydrogenase (oxaloacetate-decarboxylating)
MDEWDIFPREAAAVAMKAQEQGVARRATTYEEEYQRASEIIRCARDMTQLLMREGFIPEAEDEE